MACISNQQSRETVVGTSVSITVSSVTTLNSRLLSKTVSNLNSDLSPVPAISAILYSRAYMKNTKLGSVHIYYSAYNKADVLEKN